MNALITSVSRKVPMIQAVRRDLARAAPGGRLYGADSDSRAIARAFVDRFWKMPRIDLLTVADMGGYCVGEGISWVIPSRDGELETLARWSQELNGAGVQVMVSAPETITACRDKLQFPKALDSLSEVVPTFAQPGELAGTQRWVVKERFGSGSGRLLLDVPEGDALLRASEFSDPVFQPFVKGLEYSIDLYRSRSRQVWGCVVRSRDLVISGESQVSTVVRHLRLEKLCRRAAEILDLRGHAVFQAIEDRQRELHLIECNPRFGGASTLAVAAGLNSFGWFFRETLNKGFAPPAFVRGTPGLKMTRYPVDRIDLSAGGESVL